MDSGYDYRVVWTRKGRPFHTIECKDHSEATEISEGLWDHPDNGFYVEKREVGPWERVEEKSDD